PRAHTIVTFSDELMVDREPYTEAEEGGRRLFASVTPSQRKPPPPPPPPPPTDANSKLFDKWEDVEDDLRYVHHPSPPDADWPHWPFGDSNEPPEEQIAFLGVDEVDRALEESAAARLSSSVTRVASTTTTIAQHLRGNDNDNDNDDDDDDDELDKSSTLTGSEWEWEYDEQFHNDDDEKSTTIDDIDDSVMNDQHDVTSPRPNMNVTAPLPPGLLSFGLNSRTALGSFAPADSAGAHDETDDGKEGGIELEKVFDDAVELEGHDASSAAAHVAAFRVPPPPMSRPSR
ncbi:Hypothetical protein, putative, partial [Bodo saltans]